MARESFLELVKLVSSVSRKRNTKMRECVDAEERLLITLKYLVTGGTFSSIAAYFARGESTVRGIVAETTQMIWHILNGLYMPVPIRDQWLAIAEQFVSIWNLENCIGDINGKHVRIVNISNAGSDNVKHRSCPSMVLMACCDAEGIFTIMIETGYAGNTSGGGMFCASAINQWIQKGGFAIPLPSPLKYDVSDSPFPFYFVAGKSFQLSGYIMRPYSKMLDNMRRVFNYRLSRGRKAIDCAFEMACETFAVLNGPICIRDAQSEIENFSINAACLLHNFVRKREGLPFVPTDHVADDNQIMIQPLPQHLTYSNARATDLWGYGAKPHIYYSASIYTLAVEIPRMRLPVKECPS